MSQRAGLQVHLSGWLEIGRGGGQVGRAQELQAGDEGPVVEASCYVVG